MRNNLPLISIILLFLLIIAAYFFSWPQYLDFKDLEAELERKSQALKEKEEYYSKLTAISVDLEKYQQEFSKIDIAIPEEISEPELLNFLQKKALENGLTLKSTSSSASPLKNKGNLSKISFNLDLIGPYPYFKNYLLDIYRNSRFFEIESITFSSPRSEIPNPNLLPQGGEPSFDFKVKLAVYYLSK